ncbi:MAG: hypothetical protein Kow0080_32920 [Candidatus Promineifilaceae bacterium]
MSSGVQQKEFIQDMLEALGDFVVEQLRFLGEGFDNAFLAPDHNHSQDYVVDVINRKTAVDMSVLRLAASQRRDHLLFRPVLQRADVMAANALAQGVAWIRDARPVSYFDKMPFARIVPYAPAALIGIPYSALPEAAGKPNDMLLTAVAHETGHYVYWHGQILREAVYEVLYNNLKEMFPPAASNQPLYAHWLEEIFSDVYAAMVGGSAAALGIQHVVSDNLRERMVIDDGEHPVAVLRPYIYTQVLAAMGLGKAATNLEIGWNDWRSSQPSFVPTGTVTPVSLNNREHPIDIEQCDAHYKKLQPLTKTLAEVKGDLSRIVDMMINLLAITPRAYETCWVTDGIVADIPAALTAKVNSLPVLGTAPRYMGAAVGWQNGGGTAVSLPLHDAIVQRRGTLWNSRPAVPYKTTGETQGWDEVALAKGWTSGPGDDPYPNRT